MTYVDRDQMLAALEDESAIFNAVPWEEVTSREAIEAVKDILAALPVVEPDHEYCEWCGGPCRDESMEVTTEEVITAAQASALETPAPTPRQYLDAETLAAIRESTPVEPVPAPRLEEKTIFICRDDGCLHYDHPSPPVGPT